MSSVRLPAVRSIGESQQDGIIRQQVIEQLMRQIDMEFRREEATSAVSSHVKH
jgi:hypothetical protein